MAQDATYQTRIYHELGGERLVAASGGTFAVESGGSIFITNSAQMTISGTLNLLSGGTLSMISGASWGIAGEDVAADDIRRILASEQGGTTVMIQLANDSLLGTSNIPKNVKIVTVVGSEAMSQGSIWLTSVSAGRELFLHLVGDVSGGFTNNNTSLTVLRSGCILLNSTGAPLASFTMHTSVASQCGVHLVAVLDNTWSIVSEIGNNLVEE